jgi:hypothetical protein
LVIYKNQFFSSIKAKFAADNFKAGGTAAYFQLFSLKGTGIDCNTQE